MENTGAGSDSAVSPDRDSVRPRRTVADRAALTVLTVGVLISGAFVGLVGPLLAISCDSCQDGVRSPLLFDDLLTAIASYGVPLITLGTVVGMFCSRRGARVGGIGLGGLLMLLIVMLILGQFTT